jgi:hypothetical protein
MRGVRVMDGRPPFQETRTMMQTQWPGLGPTIDLSSLDAAAGDGRRLWPGDGGFTALPSQAADSVARPWWTCGTGTVNGGVLGGLLGAGGGLLGGGFGASGGSLFGVVAGLVNALQQLANMLFSQSTAPNQGGSPSPLPGGPQQRFADVDVSSTGDPHIAEVGTRAGTGADRAVDAHWDSMTSHEDLVHSNQIEGGYRVSTSVTAPAANGVTSNESATVHANFDQDAITMRRDGSFTIYEDGEELALGRGEAATLAGGETVTTNQDGSLTVSARGGHRGTIATTLRATGGGVDVTTHAHELVLGGDAIAHGAHRHRHANPVRHVTGPAVEQP